MAEYLERKYQIQIPYENGILDRREEPKAEELEDSFLKYAGKVPNSRRDTNAYRLYGEKNKDGFLSLTCFQIPVKEVLQKAHEYNATLTSFLSAVIMLAICYLQKEKNPNPRRYKRVKVLIPANLRSIFPSKTMRNFAMFTVPEIDPRLGDYSIQEICDIVKHKMGLEFTQKHMSSVIATNVNDERNPLLRLLPLPIKNMVMKAVFDNVGERKSCLTLSNLGQAKVPDIMAQYVKRVDFILRVQASAPYNCGVISYGDTMYLNFIRDIKDADLERHVHVILRDLGLPVTVESNQNERG